MVNVSKEGRLLILKNRLHVLSNRGDKNLKCPGVIRKLTRQIRNLESELGIQSVELNILRLPGTAPKPGFICLNGGIGRRVRLRIWCHTACEFESHFRYHMECRSGIRLIKMQMETALWHPQPLQYKCFAKQLIFTF